jgi:foldase protein PrsA
MKKNINLIIIAILAIAVICETIYIASGKANMIPKLENGEEAIVELNDGTKYSATEIWNEIKLSNGLTNLLDKVDSKILEEEYKDAQADINTYMQTAELSIKAQYKDDNGNYDEKALTDALQNYGYSSLDAYLKTVKSNYLTNKAATDYAKTLLTDSEIKAYYKSDIKPDLTGVHILVKPTATDDASVAAAKTKAEEIIKDINKKVQTGMKIEDAFKTYDEDSDDATLYQDLGTFNYADMVEDFSKAAYDLKEGQMSKTPVKTSYGYHVILITKVGEKKSLDDVKEEIKTKLAEKKVENDSTISITAMDKLREKYGMKIIDSELSERYKRYINYQLNQKSSNQ